MNKKIFSLLMLMLQSVNAWPKDATELYHTWVKGFKPSIHQCNYVFLIGYQLSYSLTGFLRRHKVSCYMICNFTNFLIIMYIFKY